MDQFDKRTYWPNRQLHEHWDATNRTYTEWDEDGVQLQTRSFSPAEDATLDALLAEQTEEDNRRSIEDQVQTVLDELTTQRTQLLTLAGRSDTYIMNNLPLIIRQMADAAAKRALYQKRTIRYLFNRHNEQD